MIGGGAGIFLVIVIIAVICVIVAINLRDLRRWKQYLADTEEANRMFADMQNPLYVGNSTQTANPAHKRKSRMSFLGR